MGVSVRAPLGGPRPATGGVWDLQGASAPRMPRCPSRFRTTFCVFGRAAGFWAIVKGPLMETDVTKPYKCIGFGATEVTKPYKFTVFGAMDVTKPYKFIGCLNGDLLDGGLPKIVSFRGLNNPLPQQNPLENVEGEAPHLLQWVLL